MIANKITKRELLQMVVSGITGVLICLLATFIGNLILVEISINYIISAVNSMKYIKYFGITFIITGIIILLRVNRLSEQHKLYQKKKVLQSFSILIILSGIISFSLERDWNQSFGYFIKIPLYIILGVSVSFLLIYGIISIINFTFGLFQKSWQRTMVETPNQIIFIVIISLLLGFLEGLLFSALNIEDINHFDKQTSLVLLEEILLIPFISVFGCIGGVANEYLRLKGSRYQPYTFEIVPDPFFEEI